MAYFSNDEEEFDNIEEVDEYDTLAGEGAEVSLGQSLSEEDEDFDE